MFGNATPVDIDWLTEAMSLRPETQAGKSGKISIEHEEHPAGKKLPVVSMRNALFMGMQPTSVQFSHPIIYRSLKCQDHGTWMTDSAQEIYQCRDFIQAVAGISLGIVSTDVLVGGLGLGCYSAILLGMTEANVTTVEISRDVIKLVAPHVRKHEIIRRDIWKFIAEHPPGIFDAAILDTWQSTGEACWVSEVIPMRRLVRPKVPQVYCWNEQEMIGQFRQCAFRKLALGAEEYATMDSHHRTLRYAAESESLLGPGLELRGMETGDAFTAMMDAEQQLSGDAKLQALLDAFCHDIGSPEWEQRFGHHWDRAEQVGKQIARRRARKNKAVA